jgi:flagellar hook-basal body complex protein FliE
MNNVLNIPTFNYDNYALFPSIVTQGKVLDSMPVTTTAEPPIPTFSAFLSEAMGNTVATDYDSKASGVDLLLGGEQDLHSILIAQQKAETILNLTVQIRNKMVESYQEIMRMQI